MSSLCIPLSISDPTREGLSRKLLSIQSSAGASLKVISIYFDSKLNEHVLWYYPKDGHLSMVF